MNQSKLILAHLRDGDFAHPGEIEAIHLAMDAVPKDPQQLVLDVGCGLGGTADYLQQHGWGQVHGIDIDADLIEYAKTHYSQPRFYHGDVLQAQQLITDKKFNVIYCFSSFFCFPQQEESLRYLANIAAKNCQLIIFDYSQLTNQPVVSAFPWSKTAKLFSPIQLNTFKQTLTAAGWKLLSSKDITIEFTRWYTQLLNQFEQKRAEMIKIFSVEAVDKMYAGYQQLLADIHAQKVGGVIVYAEKR